MNARILLIVSVLMWTAACSRDPNVVKQASLESGNKYFTKGKYKEAAIMYRRAIAKDKLFGEAYYRLALVDLKMAQPGDAMRNLLRTTELQPNNQDAYSKLIDLYMGFMSAAPPNTQKIIRNDVRALSEKLLKRDPHSYDGLRAKGYLSLQENDVPSALAAFEEANRVKPGQPEMVVALTQTLGFANRFDDAQKLARDFLSRTKDNGAVYDTLANEYLKRNQFDKAEELLKQKLQYNPKKADYILGLANFYFLTRREPEVKATLQKLLDNRQEFTDARLRVGDFWLQHRNFEAARNEFQAGLTEDTKNKVAYQKRIAQVYVYQSKNPEALAVVNDILKEDPKDSEAIAMRGTLNLDSNDKGKLPGALADLQNVVGQKPADPVIRFNLARAQLASGNADQAVVNAQSAVSSNPGFVPARILLAELYRQRGDLPKALEAANAALEVAPNNLIARLIRTDCMIRVGPRNTAREELNTLLKAVPDNRDALFQLGVLDLSEGKFPDAGERFSKLTSVNDPRGPMGQVEVAMGLGKRDQAMQMLQAELARNPNRMDYHLALANVARASKQWDLALSEYAKLMDRIKDQPRSAAEIHARVGETLREKGDVPGAVQSYRKAVQLDPQASNYLVSLAQTIELTDGKEEAKQLYEKALKMEADNPIALNNLAYQMAERGSDLDNALTLAQRAKQRWPQNLDISDTLGYIYIQKKLPDTAIGIYRDVLKQQPNRATYRVHLAMALYDKGEREEAKKELDLASRSNPSASDLQAIRNLRAKV